MLILEQIACGFSGSNLASWSINLHGDWIAREDYCNRDFAEQRVVAYSIIFTASFQNSCKNVLCFGVIQPSYLKAEASIQQKKHHLILWINICIN